MPPGFAYLMWARHSLYKGILAACVYAAAFGAGAEVMLNQAHAQDAEGSVFGKPNSNPDAQMLLQADQLIYDNDAEVVTATGSVQIDYDGYNLVAHKVSYNQKTKRIVASGNVEIIEPNGHKIFADRVDITDDFGDGFLNALRVETPLDTRIASESAERFAGQKTVFNHGVYTACKACKDNPDKPPFWQIKAKTVILDGVEKTITYRHARFELFGLPIAYLPWFRHADPSVKRKSGFLRPQFSYSEKLGDGITVPYFLVTGPSHDLTISETWYSKQGFLTAIEWRHQLDNGYYNIRAAGIDQDDPSLFINQNNSPMFAATPDSEATERGMLATTGAFYINPRWTFGWDVMLQSDRTFSQTYKIPSYSNQFIDNEIYLRGMHDRSYFDLSAYQFLVQAPYVGCGPATAVCPPTGHGPRLSKQDQQAQVHPVLDYNYVKSEPVLGGQLAWNVNAFSITRTDPNAVTPASDDIRFHGIDGGLTRASLDVEWKRTLTTSSGMAFTPSLSFEGNAFFIRPDGESTAPVINANEFRAMPTIGLEYRWPILATHPGGSHIFEPIAQIFVRPNSASVATLPNEDAQSLVFDTSNLFERNKFSGYDRLEGGVRANLGLRYSGVFDNGTIISALAGQSFHLAGTNPYARENDVVNAGEESGLETDASDYVAMLGLKTNFGLYFETRGRFDEKDFATRRLEASASFTHRRFSLSAGYAFIDSQPDYGFVDKREQATASGSLRLGDYWRIFGSAHYDIRNNSLINDSFGISYDDECFSMSLTFSENRRRYSNEVSGRTISLRLGFRTVGDVGYSQNPDDFNLFQR